MKESNFINKNLKSWNVYEKIFSQEEKKPEELSNLFIKITDDLSYANTYYKTRSVRLYLNSFAKMLFNRVNLSEGYRLSHIKNFFLVSVPLAIYQARKEFLIAFAVFVASMTIGILSSIYDPDFSKLILGDEYVKMTQANIEKNDPMAVYKSQAPFDMFFAITINNCLIAIRTFVFGILLAIGTIVVLIYNGIMLGAFQYFFVEQGLFKVSFLTIWQHGVFEISSIILAGAAGLVLGKGLIFPGNYTRFQSLRISARRGLKLIVGLIPVLVVAAFIEGFYTRFTDAPVVVRLITILLSVAFIIGYFIVLPYFRSRTIQNEIPVSDKVEITGTTYFNPNSIYSTADLFMLTFQVLKNNFGKILKWVSLLALILPGSLIFLRYLNLLTVNEDDDYWYYNNLKIAGNLESVLIILLSFILLFIVLKRMNIASERKPEKPFFVFLTIIQLILVGCLVHLPLLIPNGFFAFLLYSLIAMFFILALVIAKNEQLQLITALIRMWKYLEGSFWKFIFLSFRFLIISALFYLVFFKLIATLNNEFIQMNLYASVDTGYKILYFIDAYYISFVLLFVFSVIYIGIQLLYFSLFEIYYAVGLMDKIKQIGKVNRIRGLIRE